MVVEINTGTSGDNYYVGYNHAVKHNIGTQEAVNQVTVQRRSSINGFSFLEAKLNAGQKWNITVNGKDVSVQVSTIGTNEDTGEAQVLVRYISSCSSDTDCNTICGLEFCNLVSGDCEASTNPTPDCCGNGQCDGGGEDITTCFGDCGRYLQAPTGGSIRFATPPGGNKFKVQALTNLEITRFTVRTDLIGTGNIQIWSSPGDYSVSTPSFELIHEESVTSDVEGQLIELSALLNPVDIDAGSDHSFLILSPDLGVKFTPGTQEGDVSVENANEITFYEGLACQAENTCISSSSFIWNGRIEYGLRRCASDSDCGLCGSEVCNLDTRVCEASTPGESLVCSRDMVSSFGICSH